MNPKDTPRAAPVAAVTGCLVAFLLIALAVVGIHDLAVTQHWSRGRSWSRDAIEAVDGATRADWVVPLAVITLLIGVVLLYAALKPRRATHRPVPDESDAADVWISPAALSQLATAAAEDVPGVLQAHSRVTARRIRVSLHTTPGSDRDQITQTATQSISDRVGALSDLPVTVQAQEAKA
ncbi:DUF6286 domain-containing protein [Branchiibius sp. NY16-3462-2]|uniref:DUF6286 domain-containing protein n=1 Tax=Branchiibius cervicis TaxID=908252 RepID=A0ABW2AU58_9MICO|nr:DUF6286 domain-containing protein [Branchiibius sp. NY16-3462-2]KYH45403.1 hypothetical protein AZH51_16175 [Branchiibius sp. NY16-3462-2]